MQKHLSYACNVGPVLPVLVGALTVMSMFSANAYRLNWGQLPLPLAVACSVALISWLIFWAIPPIRKVAPILATLVTVVVMLWSVLGSPILIVAIVILVTLVALRIRNLTNVTTYVTSGLLIITLAALAASGIQALVKGSSEQVEMEQTAITLKSDNLPDIYFIVPDRFPSAEALRESGYDPDEFVEALRAREFYVREDSASPDTLGFTDGKTPRTLSYLASALNMTELDSDIEYDLARGMLENHLVGEVLQTAGYTYHHIGSWWGETSINKHADRNYIYRGFTPADYVYQDEFAAAVLQRSIANAFNIYPLSPCNVAADFERRRHQFQLDSVKEIASSGQTPVFVFAHLMLPHPPYLWTGSGQPQEASTDDLEWLYLEQVEFAEGYLLDMIDSILIKNPEAVIIVQADEGMKYDNAEWNRTLSEKQWRGVLTAWYTPNSSDAELDSVEIHQILKHVIEKLSEE
jgi:hypothetical protein